MKEAVIQKKIIDYLESEGYYTVKTILCNKKGVPDILACSPKGRFVAIEVKALGGRTSKLQDYNLQRITNTGGVAMVARSVDEVRAQLEASNVL